MTIDQNHPVDPFHPLHPLTEADMDPELDGVIDVIVTALGIENRRDELDASTTLFGGIPELDSLAVLEVVTSLEDRFDITVEDEDVTGDVFETIGTLANFVRERARA